MTVNGPGSEDSDGSESASERPWTLSIAGSWTSIMVIKRREEWRDGDTRAKRSKREERGHQGNVTNNNEVRSAFAVQLQVPSPITNENGSLPVSSNTIVTQTQAISLNLLPDGHRSIQDFAAFSPFTALRCTVVHSLIRSRFPGKCHHP